MSKTLKILLSSLLSIIDSSCESINVSVNFGYNIIPSEEKY
jgi:hypothetical protein